MRKVLEELYHGNVNPVTKQYHRGTKYDDSLRMMCKNEDKLLSTLEGKVLETFEKYKDCKEEVEQYDNEDAFVSGFRLGARLVIEAFCEEDGFFMDMDA